MKELADKVGREQIDLIMDFLQQLFDYLLGDDGYFKQDWTMVDFTLPGEVMANLRAALSRGVSPVVGTTGLSAENLTEIDRMAREKGIGAFVAPNFAIGAVLMMQFAAQAARYLPDVEIIELHHEKKVNSPSGTALLTAQKIGEARRAASITPCPPPDGLVEKAPEHGERAQTSAATCRSTASACPASSRTRR